MINLFLLGMGSFKLVLRLLASSFYQKKLNKSWFDCQLQDPMCFSFKPFFSYLACVTFTVKLVLSKTYIIRLVGGPVPVLFFATLYC